jgi:hypothetical protein
MEAWPEFRRRALLVAVGQINELSDLHVEVETRSSPGSKKVTHLRFQFREQEGKMVQSLRQTETRRTIYQVLRGEFGIGTVDLQAITRNAEEYTPERIQAAIDFVRHRMKRGGKKVKLPGRLFMKALQEGWTVPEAERDEPPALPVATVPGSTPGIARTQGASEAATPDPLQLGYQQDGEKGFAQYLALDEVRQAEVRAAFARTRVFRVLQAQLQREKGPLTPAELQGNDRLCWALGNYLLSAKKKAAAKKADGAGPVQLGLMDN